MVCRYKMSHLICPSNRSGKLPRNYSNKNLILQKYFEDLSHMMIKSESNKRFILADRKDEIKGEVDELIL